MQLPIDNNNKGIQTLAPYNTVSLTIGVTSVAISLPSGAKVVRLASTGNCYVAFSGTATTSDMLFPLGAETFKVPDGATQISCIREGASSGTLTITRME